MDRRVVLGELVPLEKKKLERQRLCIVEGREIRVLISRRGGG